ncbi:hypothetical protein BLOT_010261 [Blomia tropicalis]|nr:hypothetical protein BLOT_010261 [Blomia tropicalis]
MIKDKNKDGYSVVHLAVIYDNLNKNKGEYSVLHSAVFIGNVNIFEKLVSLFSDYNKNVLIELLKEKNKFGNSVLNTAAEGDNIEIIEQLFAGNFAIDIVYSYDISKYVSCNLNSLSKILVIFSEIGSSALHFAVSENNVEIVENLTAVFNGDKVALIEFVKDKTKNEWSALHYAADENNVQIVGLNMLKLLNNNNIHFIHLCAISEGIFAQY